MTVDSLDILLPIRPRPPRLGEVLRSLQDQSYENWRLIVLLDRDDGGNRRFIEKRISDRETIFIDCNYEKQGFSAMLNIGLRASSSRLLARQDDDDVSLPWRLAQQVALLKANTGAVAVAGHARVVDGDGNVLYSIKQPVDTNQLTKALLRRNVIPHSSVLFRRDCVLDIGGYDEQVHGCEDYHLWLRLLSVGSLLTVGCDVLEILHHSRRMSRSALRRSAISVVNTQKRLVCKRFGITLPSCWRHTVMWTAEQKFVRYLR
jgi:glycosyltransferase involved in cell wall biosynthesis